MTRFPTRGDRRRSRGAQSQNDATFARSRPHLPDAGRAAASRRHPLHLFRSHRPQVVVRFRHDRARHRQLLHGDVLFPVGTVRLAGHRAQGARANFFADRLLRLGLPFVICAFTVIPIAYYAISLRQHPDIGFSEFWWKMVTVGPVAERADLVRLGAAGVRPDGQPAVPAVAQSGRSDQPPFAARSSTSPPVFFRFCLPSPPSLYIPGADWLRTQPLVRVRAVLGPGQPRAALCDLLLFRRRHRRRAFGPRAARRDGRLAKSSWGWMAVTLVPYCLLWVMIYIKREILGNPSRSRTGISRSMASSSSSSVRRSCLRSWDFS